MKSWINKDLVYDTYEEAYKSLKHDIETVNENTGEWNDYNKEVPTEVTEIEFSIEEINEGV